MILGRIYILIVIIITLSNLISAQELFVVFASNLDNSGGVNGEDNSGADLYSVKFNPQTQSVSDLRRLTNTAEEVEFFPSLSPNLKWIAYNHQSDGINEVRLYSLSTSEETNIFSGGRFPEWVNDSTLLVTYTSPDTQDVFILQLDLNNDKPIVLNKEQITNRIRCPDTSIGSDAFPYANGEKLVFNVLRPDRQTGAAMASINSDGLDYRRLTDWNGSGHGVATPDGHYVATSNSQTGKAVMLEVLSDTVIFNYLPLSPFGVDLSEYDIRYANIPVCSFAYQAWGNNDYSLFHSVTGNNENVNIALTRLLYTSFDSTWQNPKIIDFSSAVESLTGKTESDFSTCSARPINSMTATGVVYVTLAMHNEDSNSINYPNYTSNQLEYLEARSKLIDFCKMIQRNQVAFNWESDWNFLLGVLKWDTPEVMITTNNKNVVRYLKEDLGISIDPHSHEHNGYNYADIAFLLDSLGVTPTNVVGGHIWDPSDAGYQNWERFKEPLAGSIFENWQWKGDILMGSATGMHREDPKPTGVWRPKDKYHYWEDDSTSNLIAIGQYAQGADILNVKELVNMYKNSSVSPSKILTSTLVVGQHLLNDQYIKDFETNTIKPLLEMQSKGEIKVVTFNELVNEWKTIYNADPNIILANSTSKELDKIINVSDFTLEQNYPNPFNPETIINYSVPNQTNVEISIFNILGQKVQTLINSQHSAGNYNIKFNANNFASGVYIYQIKAENNVISKKMMLVK